MARSSTASEQEAPPPGGPVGRQGFEGTSTNANPFHPRTKSGMKIEDQTDLHLGDAARVFDYAIAELERAFESRPVPTGFAKHDYMRFLRARKGDVDAAAQQIENYVNWKTRVGVKTDMYEETNRATSSTSSSTTQHATSTTTGGRISSDRGAAGGAPAPSSSSGPCGRVPEHKYMWSRLREYASVAELDREIQSCYPQGWGGVDKEGRPIYVERIGKAVPAKVAELFDQEKLEILVGLQSEHTRHLKYLAVSRKTGQPIFGNTSVVDLRGVSISLARHPIVRKLIKLMSRVCSENFPESADKIIIVGAPWGFETAWNILKGLLDPRTAEKVIIKRKHEDIYQYIDKSQLPDFLGGSIGEAQYRDDYHPGHPWASDEFLEEVSRKGTLKVWEEVLGAASSITTGKDSKDNSSTVNSRTSKQGAGAPPGVVSVSTSAGTSTSQQATISTSTPQPSTSGAMQAAASKLPRVFRTSSRENAKVFSGFGSTFGGSKPSKETSRSKETMPSTSQSRATPNPLLQPRTEDYNNANNNSATTYSTKGASSKMKAKGVGGELSAVLEAARSGDALTEDAMPCPEGSPGLLSSNGKNGASTASCSTTNGASTSEETRSPAISCGHSKPSYIAEELDYLGDEAGVDDPKGGGRKGVAGGLRGRGREGEAADTDTTGRKMLVVEGQQEDDEEISSPRAATTSTAISKGFSSSSSTSSTAVLPDSWALSDFFSSLFASSSPSSQEVQIRDETTSNRTRTSAGDGEGLLSSTNADIIIERDVEEIGSKADKDVCIEGEEEIVRTVAQPTLWILFQTCSPLQLGSCRRVPAST
ncbi:unnamed protein product [Amoebophrya sp. A25]|nr:unnamed protein product [Amoebophrya sp. A25]|eukprot:GSA25T00019879001.1